MTISRIVLAAIGLTMAVSTANAAEWTVKKMNEQVDSTNFIVGEGKGHCSGTLISLHYRLILTNHHCITKYVSRRTKEVVKNGVIQKVQVEDLREVRVSQKSYANYKQVGSASWQADLVARWKGSDLALLQIKAKSIPHKQAAHVFAGDNVYRGSTVWAVGNPLMLDSTISKGVVSNVNRTLKISYDGDEVPFLQITAPIAGGSSGGSLYNERGELIGVPAAGTSQASIGLAIPYFRIQKFLTDNCYQEVWDKSEGVDTYKTCTDAKEDK